MRSPVRRVRRISQHINHHAVTLTRNLGGYISHFRRWALPVFPILFSLAFFRALIMVMHMSKEPSSQPWYRQITLQILSLKHRCSIENILSLGSPSRCSMQNIWKSMAIKETFLASFINPLDVGKQVSIFIS